jgi:hypothetical protein
MIKITFLRVLAFSVVLIALANLSGCASIQGRKSEDRLIERVRTYWDAREKGDYATQFRLDASSLTKQLTLKEYAGRPSVAEILDYKIKKVQINEEKSEATVRLQAKVRMKLTGFSSAPLEKEIIDWWVFEDNDWYHKERSFSQRKR